MPQRPDWTKEDNRFCGYCKTTTPHVKLVRHPRVWTCKYCKRYKLVDPYTDKPRVVINYMKV